MISLIFVPLLFWIYSKPTIDKLNLRVIDFGLPAKVKKGENIPKYEIIPIAGWNYKPVNINPNFGEKDELYFKSLIEKMMKENIEMNGIKFQFTDENTYGDFVKILNLMSTTNQEVYGLDSGKSNSFYVLYKNPFVKEKNSIDGNAVYPTEKYNANNTVSFYEKLMRSSTKQSLYLILGYLVLLCCSILKSKFTFNL